MGAVRIGGAVFLLYLAFDALRTAKKMNTEVTDELTDSLRARGTSLRKTFVSPILNNLANPKVVLFFVAFVPHFITTGGWTTNTQILFLGLVLIAVGVVMDGAIGVGAGTFSAQLLARPSVQHRLKRVSALIFGGLAVRLLVTDCRDPINRTPTRLPLKCS